jgi:hypothetical protein
MKNGGRGSVGASWLAISGGQVTTSYSEESKLPTRKVNCRRGKYTIYDFKPGF